MYTPTCNLPPMHLLMCRKITQLTKDLIYYQQKSEYMEDRSNFLQSIMNEKIDGIAETYGKKFANYVEKNDRLLSFLTFEYEEQLNLNRQYELEKARSLEEYKVKISDNDTQVEKLRNNFNYRIEQMSEQFDSNLKAIRKEFEEFKNFHDQRFQATCQNTMHLEDVYQQVLRREKANIQHIQDQTIQIKQMHEVILRLNSKLNFFQQTEHNAGMIDVPLKVSHQMSRQQEIAERGSQLSNESEQFNSLFKAAEKVLKAVDRLPTELPTRPPNGLIRKLNASRLENNMNRAQIDQMLRHNGQLVEQVENLQREANSLKSQLYNCQNQNKKAVNPQYSNPRPISSRLSNIAGFQRSVSRISVAERLVSRCRSAAVQ